MHILHPPPVLLHEHSAEFPKPFFEQLRIEVPMVIFVVDLSVL
jgi:hypothetical protein